MWRDSSHSAEPLRTHQVILPKTPGTFWPLWTGWLKESFRRKSLLMPESQIFTHKITVYKTVVYLFYYYYYYYCSNSITFQLFFKLYSKTKYSLSLHYKYQHHWYERWETVWSLRQTSVLSLSFRCNNLEAGGRKIMTLATKGVKHAQPKPQFGRKGIAGPRVYL